jgi:hypothetical protein
VVAAVDFGTFGSGFAWAVTTAAGEYLPSHAIYCRDRWADAPTFYPKTRSAILLGDNGETVAWGYQAVRLHMSDPTKYPLYAADFKMLLESGRSDSGEHIGRNETRRPTGFLIASYLRGLYQEARREIAQAGYDDTRVAWYLTVPAIWSDYDRQVMRRAAVEAGFPAEPSRLAVVLEPEVAALYCLANEARARAGAGQRGAGSRILVVDCGGGTTDLVPLTTRADGMFDQVGRSTGDTCGAARVSREFAVRHLSRRLGYEALEELGRSAPAVLNDLVGRWEQARDVFDPAARTPIRIELSSAASKRLGSAVLEHLAATQDGVDDVLLVSPIEALTLLDSSVDPICELVEEQLGRFEADGPAPISVFLVGGFANSLYLRRRLERIVEQRADLFVPPRPENAVLFGAVHYANNPVILSRTMSRTYGYGLLDDFDPGRDGAERRVVGASGKNYCAGRFRVLVRRDELVPNGKAVTTRIYPRDVAQTEVNLAFYSSFLTDPRYVDAGDADKIGTVRIVLPGLPAGRRLAPRDRAIDVLTIFGETMIRIQAIDQLTGFRTDGQIDFVE